MNHLMPGRSFFKKRLEDNRHLFGIVVEELFLHRDVKAGVDQRVDDVAVNFLGLERRLLRKRVEDSSWPLLPASHPSGPRVPVRPLRSTP